MKAPWGSHVVIARGPGYKVKILRIKAGHRISLQRHKHRAELWVVLEGRATFYRSAKFYSLDFPAPALVNAGPGASFSIEAGQSHRISAEGQFEDVVILEVQRGEILEESDIERLEDDYGRARKGASAGRSRRSPSRT